MGGKSHSSNDQMVQFEMQQAQQAQEKEAERQARLASGTQQVNDIFQGGGFDDNFYNKYTQAQTDYYMPQVQTQYEQAKNKLTYDLARAGTLRSSAAGYAQGLLENQNAVNEAGVNAAADTQTAALRSNILNEQQQAINQLYATEDPSIAANTATSMVQQGQLSTPNLNPLGALFTPLAVGATGALSNLTDQYNINKGLQAAGINTQHSTIGG